MERGEPNRICDVSKRSVLRDGRSQNQHNVSTGVKPEVLNLLLIIAKKVPSTKNKWEQTGNNKTKARNKLQTTGARFLW